MGEQFVYVTYIRTTPEKLWNALIQPEFTRKYWVESWQDCEWKVGAVWKLMGPDNQVKDSGQVLEFNPFTRFSVSWRNEFIPAAKAEGYSRASFDLEPDRDAVKLTVTHSFETVGTSLHAGVSDGWPKILSSLKSLLETGDTLDVTRRWPAEA